MQYKYYKMINKKIGHEENEPCGGGSVRGKEGKVALAKGGDENALSLGANVSTSAIGPKDAVTSWSRTRYT